MTGHLEKHHAEEWGAYCEIRKRTKAEVAAVKKEEVESYEMENSEVRFYDVRSSTYLIFVTDSRTVSVEKKSVMWRNFKFLYMTDVEKSKIHPHVD